MAKKGGRYRPISKERERAPPLALTKQSDRADTAPAKIKIDAVAATGKTIGKPGSANTSERIFRVDQQQPCPTLRQLSPWSDLTVAELKPYLRKWNLHVSGRKAELIKRLEKYQEKHNKSVGAVVGRPPACSNKSSKGGWSTSKAKLLLIEMHRDNKYPIHNLSAEEVYKLHPEFQLHPFERFKENLKSLRAAVTKEKEILEQNHKDFAHEQFHFPRKKKTSRGEHFWDTHAANILLQQDLKDIKEGRKEELAPSKLRASRKEYQDFTGRKFCSHVHQEKRNQRETAYWIPKRNKMGHQKHQDEVKALKNELDNRHFEEELTNIEDLLGALNFDR